MFSTHFCVSEILKNKKWMELSRKFLRCLTMKNNKMTELEDNCKFKKFTAVVVSFELMRGMPNSRQRHFHSLEHVWMLRKDWRCSRETWQQKERDCRGRALWGTLSLLKLIGEKVMCVNGSSGAQIRDGQMSECLSDEPSSSMN